LQSLCTIVGIFTSPLFPIETCPIQAPSIPPQPQHLSHSHSAAAPASEPHGSQPPKPKRPRLQFPQQHPACWHSVPIRQGQEKNETRMRFVPAFAFSGVRGGAAAETREAHPGKTVWVQSSPLLTTALHHICRACGFRRIQGAM
jgi:hypothetical protein